jgi:hypothetical protein
MAPFCSIKAPGGSRGTPGLIAVPRAMLTREKPNDPESPDFRPGLFVKLASGPEGRVSTSGRRPAKKKSHDAMFFVKQRPRTSVRGFLSN